MENKLIDRIANTFNVELPQAESMDEFLDLLLPKIRHLGEDLREEKFYVGRHWIEIRDDEDFHELVLHVFNPEEEYILSTDGEVWFGKWRYLGNKLIFGKLDPDEDDPTGEAFELAFMDPEFMILKKLSNPLKLLLNRKYFVLVAEPLARRMEWRELMELLFNKYRNNSSFYITVVLIVLLIVAIIMALS